jgi:glyceraldehyde 3-phosphate dehydrogenase
MRVGINGFGRIGRLVMRAILESATKNLELVAINDLGDIEQNLHLLKYDSVHGTLSSKVELVNEKLMAGDHQISFYRFSSPKDIPWNKNKVDIVLECTGFFTDVERAKEHILAGAKKVLISAPSNNADLTVVYGVNHNLITEKHDIISNASCTTNCLAPIAKVVNDNFKIEAGFMTTVHSFTSDQKILDGLHKDLRRARTASISMIPTSTGAAKAVALVLPELQGKLDGTAIRIPTPNVSMIDFTFNTQQQVSVESINSVIKAEVKDSFKNIIEYNEAPLVSVDFNHNASSSVFDATQTQVVGDKFGRILSWYDNEWGFSNRMIDVSNALGKFL